MNHQLNQIAGLIKANKLEQARYRLQSYFESYPKDAHAWYLLSFAERSQVAKITAVKQALKLDPKNANYEARLSRLIPHRRAVEHQWMFVLGIVFGAAALITASGIIVGQSAFELTYRLGNDLGVVPTCVEVIQNEIGLRNIA